MALLKLRLSKVFMNKLLINLITIYVACFAISCGYKPMAYFANRALGESVYVELKVNLENTEESAAIKDAVNEAIYSRFHSKIASKERADSILTVNVERIVDGVIATNSQGFATFYRVNVTINFKFVKDGKTYNFSNLGYYDYAASINNPVTTYQNRQSAILEAAAQSLDRFISQVGYAATF